MNEKIYTPGQAFQLAGSFFCEICESCGKIFNSSKGVEFFKYPFLETREITCDQFQKLIMLATDMNWYIDWVKEWQESIIRLRLCNSAMEIEGLLLNSGEILDIAYDMLEFKHARRNFDFIPILVVIRKVQQGDRHFLEAISLWKRLINLLNNNTEQYNFSYYCYDDLILYDQLPPIKQLERLSKDQKMNVEKSIDLYLKNYCV